MSFDRLTVSFSIDGRTADGQKRSAFFSTTVSNQDSQAPGWTTNEVQAVSAIVSKQVVATTFRDAKVRRILGPDEATRELKTILDGYNSILASSAKRL